MRNYLAALGALAALVLAAPAAAQGQGDTDPELGSHVTAGRIGIKLNKPISRERLDKALAGIFADVDADRNGLFTLDEFNAAIAARKAEMIAERFRLIDTNRNGSIGMDEFAAWQATQGSVVLRDPHLPPPPLAAAPPDVLYIDVGSKQRDQAIEGLIVPLSAKVVVEGNTDYDAGLSLAEFVAYEGARFDKADANGDGWLDYIEYDELD